MIIYLTKKQNLISTITLGEWYPDNEFNKKNKSTSACYISRVDDVPPPHLLCIMNVPFERCSLGLKAFHLIQ